MVAEASPALALAQDAVLRGDLAVGLVRLLEAWRGGPAPDLAHAIEVVGARAAQGLHSPTGATVRARDEAWTALAHAGDPVVRHVLLASLAENRGTADTLARIELLVPHRDPRIAARIADLIATPIYTASSSRTAGFWKRVFAILPTLGDPRLVERARGFEAAWETRALRSEDRDALRKRLVGALPLLIRAYPVVPTLSPDDAARLATIVGAITGEARPRTADELLAAIYAAPDDDCPRMVYADWLQDRGDPRGEFIALQLAHARGEQAKASIAREAELLAEHYAQWLGPVAAQIVRSSARFERGFLAACHIKCDRVRLPVASEIWATVREVHGDIPATEMPALRTVTGIGDPTILRLATFTGPLAIEEIVWASALDAPLAAETLATFAAPVLPKLRRLELRGTAAWIDQRLPPAQFAWAWSRPGLVDFATSAHLTELGRWLADLANTAIERIALCDQPARHWERGWRIAVDRDPCGALSRLVATAPPLAHTVADFGAPLAVAIEMLRLDQLTAARIELPRVPPAWQPQYEILRGRLEAALARQVRLGDPMIVQR